MTALLAIAAVVATTHTLTVVEAAAVAVGVDARFHGALGDGVTDDTAAIQATIDTAASLYDGSAPIRARLTSGVYLSGTLFLRSGVFLFLDGTAILKASMNATLFPHDADWPGQGALVVGERVDHAGVAGSGVIDGQAPMFVTSLDQATDQFEFTQYHSPLAGAFRLRLVDFRHSSNVQVSGISLMDATSFHVHFLNSSEVLVEGVTISSDLRWPNCDGIDITSCNNTIIRHCNVRTGDDAFSPKTWQGYGPLRNLLIEGGIHFGASAWHDYINVTVRRVQVLDSHGGMLIQVRGPGSVVGLHVSEFMVGRTTFNAPCRPWMGNAQPIVVSADQWAAGPTGRAGLTAAGSISDLTFENVTAQAENGVFLSGRVGGIDGVTFKNMNVVIQQKPANNASWGPCPAHNYWPTDKPHTPVPFAPHSLGGVVAPIDGLYLEHARNVRVEGLSVSFVGDPKPGNTYGRCFFADPNTTSGIIRVPESGRCIGENASAPSW